MVIVVLPAYNEQQSLPALLGELRAVLSGAARSSPSKAGRDCCSL